MLAKSKNSEIAGGWRQHLGSLLPILAVYSALAFYGLDRHGLWEDEFLSVARMASPTPIWKDGHGFLYFALLHVWMQAGTSEFMLRSLSVLFGGMAVCLTYLMGSTLCKRRVAVVGTILLATSPFFIWYSQEVRYITLMLVTTLLMMYTFRQVITRGGHWWWLAHGSTTLLAFFSFVLTILLPVAQGLYLLMSRSRRFLVRKWVICQMVTFALFVCWVVNGTHFWKAFIETIGGGQQAVFFDPKQQIMVDFTALPPAPIPYTFFVLSTGFSLGPSPRELHTARFAALAPHAATLLLTGGLFGSLTLLGLITLRDHQDSRMLLLLWIAVPILGILGLSALTGMIYSVHYVAMVLPAYMLVLGAGVSNVLRPMVQMALLGAVLVVNGVALANYYANPRYAREDIRAAAQYLESTAGPQDIILVVGTVSSLPYYYKGGLPMTRLGNPARIGSPLADRLQELAGHHDRLWLVQIRPWQTDRKGNLKAVLDNTYDLVEHQHFAGVDIYSYQVSK